LKDDLGEANDLSVQYPDQVKELSGLLSDRLRKWDSPMPFRKNTGKPVPFPDETY
jgi:hypothetical protein